MSQWIMRELGPDVPLHFSAFHPDWKMMDVPATPAATLTRARDIALKAGLHYVYTGNVHDTTGGTTFCPSCHEALIVRDWYRIDHYSLDARRPLPALRHRHRRPLRRVQPSLRQPPHPDCHAPRGSGMSTSTLVHIPAGGATIEGMLEIPERAVGLVLFAHGSGSSRHSPRNNYVAGVLRAAGVGTLLMDLLTPEEDRDYSPPLRHRAADAAPAGSGALGGVAAGHPRSAARLLRRQHRRRRRARSRWPSWARMPGPWSRAAAVPTWPARRRCGR